MTTHRGRWGALALALSVFVVLGSSLSFGAIEASSTLPKPDRQSTSLISFRLDPPAGQILFPNRNNYAQHAASPGALLLFLPATGAQPSDYRMFLRTAVASGYNVLGLDYWNRGKSVVNTCGGDPECYTAVQRNRFDGTVPSAVSNVEPANSILNRLTLALTQLETVDPAGQWGRYLDHGQVDWSRIVLAGHSQGGGESAYIAHLHLVHGVLMFSSPVLTDDGAPAAWMREPGMTPASRMYGFVNQNDMYFSKIAGSWSVLQLQQAGSPALVDVPRGSHQLVSTLDMGTPAEAHGRTVTDGTAQSPDGVPLYQPTWEWMLDQTK
ncbi:alpha/beta fold hydrolase [Frigoribacterium sp. CG_9.8]|uniref:BPSS1187 family protein n=1 Tax=Frigoribacterium sp. CG_9.8 TaxID=2787733 RepID=UPI0018C8DD6B|nr:alpha/beta fold hydrolase [Frigoribacterium sp. CG_9.8]MBG6108126.1 pimeloyl-ACP methyl ester carboxylesterase [Frigoribacterium sp. CG_9.8]